MYYSIDFRALIKMLVPVRLRKPVTLSWLKCLVQPVTDIYNLFVQNRNNNLYLLQHNSQVVYLQAALNDTFDATDRGIYIIDGSIADPLFLFLNAENHPLWLGLNAEEGTTAYPDPQWLYTGAETAYNAFNFLVMVPVAVVYDTDRMRALIDRYRLPSKGSYMMVSY